MWVSREIAIFCISRCCLSRKLLYSSIALFRTLTFVRVMRETVLRCNRFDRMLVHWAQISLVLDGIICLISEIFTIFEGSYVSQSAVYPTVEPYEWVSNYDGQQIALSILESDCSFWTVYAGIVFFNFSLLELPTVNRVSNVSFIHCSHFPRNL